MADVLRFRARGKALAQDFEAQAGRPSLNRFLGRRLAEMEAAVGVEGTPDFKPARHAWIDTGEVAEKRGDSPYAHLYFEMIVHGALWPADEATAKAAEHYRRERYANTCGSCQKTSCPKGEAGADCAHCEESRAIVFDPSFGGEEPGPDAATAAAGEEPEMSRGARKKKGAPSAPEATSAASVAHEGEK